MRPSAAASFRSPILVKEWLLPSGGEVKPDAVCIGACPSSAAGFAKGQVAISRERTLQGCALACVRSVLGVRATPRFFLVPDARVARWRFLHARWFLRSFAGRSALSDRFGRGALRGHRVPLLQQNRDAVARRGTAETMSAGGDRVYFDGW